MSLNQEGDIAIAEWVLPATAIAKLEIEQKAPSLPFETYKEIYGSDIQSSRHFFHHGIPNGYLIRLVASDWNGNLYYSNSEMIKRTNFSAQITVFPNPVSETLTVDFGGVPSTGNLRLINQMGAVFVEVKFDEATQLALPMEKVSSGGVFLSVQLDDGRVYSQILTVR